MDPLTAVVVLLVVLWITGFGFHVGGAFVHLFLVCALVIFVVRALMSNRP